MRVYADFEWELVYSTAYLRQDANRWAQEDATSHLGYRRIATRSYGIAYDARSGNILAAMGIQGAVVGAPNGEWTPVAVGRYAPTDFSFFAKARRMLSYWGFWAAVLPLALTMTSFGVALAYPEPSLKGLAAGGLALLLAFIALGAWRATDNVDIGPTVSADAHQFLLGAPAIGLAVCALSSACREERLWRLALPASAGVAVIAVLPFMLWLRDDLPLGLAMVSALVLTALAAFGLFRLLRRQQLRQSEQGEGEG
ncbi:MAG: hypothetical protein J4F32_03985 [Dehalococcoidia bacterium]|nr:hypothetical protein [Dehalococcoidia bacterium]